MSLCLMITFHTVNMKCNEECWMLCDDRLNTHVSSDGQRTTLLGYLPMVEASTDRWTSKVELSVDHQMIHVCSSEYRWLRIQRYGRISNVLLTYIAKVERNPSRPTTRLSRWSIEVPGQSYRLQLQRYQRYCIQLR